MKYRLKPQPVEAFTFDEIIEYGIKSGAPLVNGMPWSFTFQGHPITHETDELYLVSYRTGTWKMTRDEIFVRGEPYWYMDDLAAFTEEYEPDSSAAVCDTTRTGIKTFHKSDGWTLQDWNIGERIYRSPLRDGVRPYDKGSTLTIIGTEWSLGCGSVYNWINNAVYSRQIPDRNDRGVYILRHGGKCCAGVHEPLTDIYVDGDWYYNISDLKVTDFKVDGKTQYKWEFTIQSLPQDVPALVWQAREAGDKHYYGSIQAGDFEILISHADPNKRRWLSRKSVADIVAAVQKASDSASDVYVMEPI